MTSKKLEGLIIALPTPLLENENVDFASLNKLIDHCITEGANGIMVLGTIGEGVSLLGSERQSVIEHTVAHTAGRIPVLATVSAASTRRTVDYVKAIERSGVDYIVCTSAFYNKFPDAESILYHLNKISESTNLPLIFYNAPGFTGNNVDVDTIEKILNMDRIAGIKDSGCNFGNFVELLRRYPDKNNRPGTIMQGDESVFDASLLMGADGLISGGGVLFIKLVAQLYKAAIENDLTKSILLQREFTDKLLKILLPNLQRNWLYNIKKELVNQQIITAPYVTGPFLSNP